MTPPSARPVTLARGDRRELVSAEVVADFPSDRLRVVEESWAEARLALPAAEHRHWDWRNKEEACADPGGRFQLFAVRRADDPDRVEGLMAVGRHPRPAELPPPGDVLYLDYLEVAPWNLKGWPAGPQLSGVGSELVAEAVLLSFAVGYGGRVGLHSLPQAADFYRRRCLIPAVGHDVPPYPDLAYFEYTETAAREFLNRIGVTP